MSNLGKKVRMTAVGPAIMCPACRHAHIFADAATARAGTPTWTFNGDGDKPTFSPSMLVFTPEHKDADGVMQPRMTICHSFVREGRIEFLGDCAHDMKGTTVDLPDFPPMEEYHTS